MTQSTEESCVPLEEDPEEDFRKKLLLICTGSIDLPEERLHEEGQKSPFQALLSLFKRL